MKHRRTAQDWLDAYGAHHRNRVNKIIHWICVPAIMFSIIGLLTCIPMGDLAGALPGRLRPWVNWGSPVVILCWVFYLRLSIPLALGFLPIGILLVGGNLALAQAVVEGGPSHVVLSLGIFAGAWVGQFIGHLVEGEKPSFLDDIKFLLVGPAWLLSAVYRRLGIRY